MYARWTRLVNIGDQQQQKKKHTVLYRTPYFAGIVYNVHAKQSIGEIRHWGANKKKKAPRADGHTQDRQ